MYAYIKGVMAHLDPAYAVVEAGGVGYHLRISLATYSKIKGSESQVLLYTYLHVTENAHTLFGFADALEKQLFLLLISVSGVGPGTAMMALSSLSAAELQNAIAREDSRTIQAIKGLGAKTAQRLIIELKDKIRKEEMMSSSSTGTATSTTLSNNVNEQALSALITLGIPKPTAEKTIETVLKSETGPISLEDLIKKALKSK
jgi:Holliday junction DNA helicase RuvA